MSSTRSTPVLTHGLLMIMAMAAVLSIGACKSSENKTHPESGVAQARAPKAANEASPALAAEPSPSDSGDTPRDPNEKDATPPTAAAQATETPSSSPTTAGVMREVFPGVRVDVAKNLVEFDGMVPIDVHNPKSPRVYLEAIACIFDSKEHESLVVTRAKPSHVHAALLMIGLEPGAPGSWKIDEQSRAMTVPPHGSPVRVSLVFSPASPEAEEIDPADLVINARTKERASSRAGAGFVFAGSRIVEWQGHSYYDADGTGTLIGLATFGSETIAWREVFSPEAAIAEPVWIADNERVPAAGTPVTVRLRPAGHE